MTTPVIRKPPEVTDLVDWGVIPTMIEGESRTTGKLLHARARKAGRNAASGSARRASGSATSRATSSATSSRGRCTYVHESGEVIEIEPDTAAFFPQDWKGVCTVHETVKKVYMIR